MTSTPRVSILITSYNSGPFLAEEVRSLMAQTYRDLEIVISDDASTDNTARIVAGLASEDSRIRPSMGQVNRGLPANYNSALEKCRGEYIATMDADDVFYPGKIETQVQFLDQHPECGLCTHDMEGFDSETGKTIRLYAEPARILGPEVVFPTRWLLGKAHQGLRPSILARSIFLRAARYDARFHATHEVLYRAECMAITKLKWGHVPEAMGRYRIHPAQLSRAGAYTDKVLEESLLCFAVAQARHPELGPLIRRHRDWYLFRHSLYDWFPPEERSEFARMTHREIGPVRSFYLEALRIALRMPSLMAFTRPVRRLVKRVARSL